MSGSESRLSMREIRDELYERLASEHGFERANQFRTPGTVHAVVKDNVEIIAVDFSQELAGNAARVVVQIHVPINAREDSYFQTYSCGDRKFLSPREQIVLRQRADIQDKIGLIVDLAQRGSAILQLCGLKPHEYIN